MATLVVGPFYLSGALQLDAARVGLVMSAGPLVAALAGVPAGRMVDRFGARSATLAGLLAMALGASILPMMPTRLGVPGYMTPLIVITAGYALFQAANNTAVMSNTGQNQRGVMSGMLNLSRNLGLITGASIMGAVFAFASGASGAGASRPEAVAIGMRATFAVAAALVFAALAIVATSERAINTHRPGYLRLALRRGGRRRLLGAGVDRLAASERHHGEDHDGDERQQGPLELGGHGRLAAVGAFAGDNGSPASGT